MRRALFAVAVAVLVALLLPRPASAAPQMAVTPNSDLDPAGQSVRVQGSGYDTERGVYVAWCVVPPAGQKPTPCGGGQDQSGSSGASAWVSSNPTMGATLANKFGPGGSFDVTIKVSRYINEIDCFAVKCAVTTRNDHENTEDRSQDVFATVRFRGQNPPATVAPVPSPATTAATRRAAMATTTTAPPITTTIPAETTATALETTTSSSIAPVEALAVSSDTDDDGGSSAPLVAGGVAVVALGAVATGLVLRRRAQ